MKRENRVADLFEDTARILLLVPRRHLHAISICTDDSNGDERQRKDLLLIRNDVGSFAEAQVALKIRGASIDAKEIS